MPIIWRYLLIQYVKVLLFCSAAFVVLLLTLRLEEIAHFATLGAQGKYIFLFICYQIPYILPIALPISALISAIILFRRLSKQHELTAMRAAGIPFSAIIAPLLIAAAFLTVANFYIVSELATDSHLSASLIKNELRSVNPLLLLNNKHLMKLKGIYFDTIGPSRLGESASQVIVAMPNKKNGRINLLIADNVEASPTQLTGTGISLLSSLCCPLDADDSVRAGDTPDRLLLENIEKTTTTIEDFSQMVQKKIWNVNNDHLSLSLLGVRLDDNLASLAEAKAAGKAQSEVKQIQRSINRIYSEVGRRLSIALALFTFTLMGACCGMSIGRHNSTRGIAIVIALSALYLAAFFSARGIDHLLIASLMLYMTPHLLIIGTSTWMLRRATRGIE